MSHSPFQIKNEKTNSEKKWQDLRDKQQEGRKKITQLEADLKNWQQDEMNQQKEVDS